MSSGRRKLNIFLIILSLLLGGWAVWIFSQPSPVYLSDVKVTSASVDSADASREVKDMEKVELLNDDGKNDIPVADPVETVTEETDPPVRATRFHDADIRVMDGGHPFRAEAIKVLSGNLEENDSLSRHRILSYCEHLRTSYTTRDIDFLRQVFSNDALIIVGHVVKSGGSSERSMTGNSKVRYSVRSKQEYLANLARIFGAGKSIDVRFSGFRIMRHPTMEGIYGVTLRQQYTSGSYSDDGYLFLLWDFRNPSMPMIHVRTWQPAQSVDDSGDGLIDMSDFNLE